MTCVWILRLCLNFAIVQGFQSVWHSPQRAIPCLACLAVFVWSPRHFLTPESGAWDPWINNWRTGARKREKLFCSGVPWCQLAMLSNHFLISLTPQSFSLNLSLSIFLPQSFSLNLSPMFPLYNIPHSLQHLSALNISPPKPQVVIAKYVDTSPFTV